ncbi:hypothetical protein K8T06_00560 [bacterium]|nr:hypothetical protein [bacterium]
MKHHGLISFNSLVLVCIFFIGLGTGCDDSLSDPGGDSPSASTTAHTGCKDTSTMAERSSSPTSDCITFQYDGRGHLVMEHINAGLNCCPGPFSNILFEINGNEIVIDERHLETRCKCECLFDLTFEFVKLQADQYRVIVKEPLVESGDDPLTFIMDLRTRSSGVFCVDRDYYPW